MARHFNGSTDYLDAGTGVRGTDLHGVLAMCWVNLDDVAAIHSPMSRWNNANAFSQWLLTVNTGGQVIWNIMDSALSGHSVAGGSITAGGWHHLAGMYDGAKMYVYVDGVATTNTPSVTMNTNVATMPTYIGRQVDDGWFAGSIAECTLILVNTGINPASTYNDVVIANSQLGASPEITGMYDTEQIDYWPLLGDSPEISLSTGFDNLTVHGTTVVRHSPTSTIFSLGRARAQATGSSVA